MYFFKNYYESVEFLVNIQIEFNVAIFSWILHLHMFFGFQFIFLKLIEARDLVEK